MPVALRMWPKYCISLEKKLHLPFFIERFADLNFSNTMQMYEKVFLWCLTEYDDVIQVSYGKREVLEYTSHQFLEVCWCLSKSEWDLYIFKFNEE